jgi:hypothetical protein
VNLPPDYAREHVGLGYVATEHGHHGDTVDVALSLVSVTTSERGFYVGATGGRDDNRMHVVTEARDLDEARDVLEAVLANDRVDVPAVAQRRALGRAVPFREDQKQAAGTSWRVPGWVEKWRLELEQGRSDAEATVNEWRAAAYAPSTSSPPCSPPSHKRERRGRPTPKASP